MALILRGSDNLDSADIVKDSTCESDIAPYNKGFKNYLINGNFDIWQRGVTQTSSDYGSDDRFANGNATSTKTHSRVACTDTERAFFNASSFSRTVVASVAGASNCVYKTHKIEDITKLAGKTVTLSFWAKANSALKLGLSGQIIFGTGGSPTANVNKAGLDQILTLSTTWTKYAITFTVPSIIGKTLGTDGVHTSFFEVTYWFDTGSTVASNYITSMVQQSGTFDIAQVQLEEGSVATPFEQRPYGLELSLCQRYYRVGTGTVQKHSDSGNHMGTQRIGFNYSMRVSPTISFSKSGTKIGDKALAFFASATELSVWGDVDYAGSAIGEFTIFMFNASAEL